MYNVDYLFEIKLAVISSKKFDKFVREFSDCYGQELTSMYIKQVIIQVRSPSLQFLPHAIRFFIFFIMSFFDLMLCEKYPTTGLLIRMD